MPLYDRSRARRSLFDTITYRMASQSATVLGYVVLVRAMSKEDFGLLNLLYSFIPLVGTAASLGLEQTLRRFQPEYLRLGNAAGAAWLVRRIALLRFLTNVVLLGVVLLVWNRLAPRFDLGPYRAALRDTETRGGAVLVAELDGEVVGLCQLIVFRHLQAHGGLCAEVESMHVHPDHRGGGVGAALLAEAVARATSLGCYRIQLTSNTARPDAHRFYERLGFVPSHVGFKMRLT